MSDLPLLEARGLKKSFPTAGGSVVVLDDVSVTLFRGEMVALLGVSGSGKSTLLQILGTLDHPTQGKVFFDGVDVFALSKRQVAHFRNQRIGFIYQFHRLLPEFSAVENVAMPLLIGRIAAKEALARARTALTDVGLEHRFQHRPGQLSGGEQQRVAMARAIVTNPDLLLADEPTGNLDGKTSLNVFELLRDLNRTRGLTCLMVTHNRELAAHSHRCFHLVDGRLLSGQPAAVALSSAPTLAVNPEEKAL